MRDFSNTFPTTYLPTTYLPTYHSNPPPTLTFALLFPWSRCQLSIRLHYSFLASFICQINSSVVLLVVSMFRFVSHPSSIHPSIHSFIHPLIHTHLYAFRYTYIQTYIHIQLHHTHSYPHPYPYLYSAQLIINHSINPSVPQS